MNVAVIRTAGVIALTAILLALGRHASAQGASADNLTNAAEAFCKRIGWTLDRSQVVIKKSGDGRGPLIRVNTGALTVHLWKDTGVVQSAANLAYGSDRRKVIRSHPFSTLDSVWFARGRDIVKLVWPDLVLTNKSCEHILPNDTPVLATNSRTVRIFYDVRGPAAKAGGRITLIFDRDEGKLISISQGKTGR